MAQYVYIVHVIKESSEICKVFSTFRKALNHCKRLGYIYTVEDIDNTDNTHTLAKDRYKDEDRTLQIKEGKTYFETVVKYTYGEVIYISRFKVE